MQFGEDRLEMVERPGPNSGGPGHPGELHGFAAGPAQDTPQHLGGHDRCSEEFSPVHILPVGVVGGSTALRLAEAQVLFRAVVQHAEQSPVEPAGSFRAPLPLRDHVGVDAKLLVVMLPCERSERLGHFLLGQAQPGALGLEVRVRPGPLLPVGVGMSHMATLWQLWVKGSTNGHF